MSKLQYRGVSYDNASHEQPSPQPVDHAYRGHSYHHRQAEAAQQVNQG